MAANAQANAANPPANNENSLLNGLAALTAQFAASQQAVLKQQQTQHDRAIEVQRMESRTKALIDDAFDPLRSAAFCRKLHQHAGSHPKDAEFIAQQAMPLSMRDTFRERAAQIKALCAPNHFDAQALLQVVYDMKTNTCFEQKVLLQTRLQDTKLNLTSKSDVQAFLTQQQELFNLEGFLLRLEAWEASPTRDPGQGEPRTFPTVDEQPQEGENATQLRVRKEKEFVEHVFAKRMSPEITMAIQYKLSSLKQPPPTDVKHLHALLVEVKHTKTAMESNLQEMSATIESALKQTMLQINTVANTTLDEVIRKVDVALVNKPAGNSRTACLTCHEEGHWSKDCPMNNFGSQHKRQKTHDSCGTCGATNHDADHCHEAYCIRCQQPGHLARACTSETNVDRRRNNDRDFNNGQRRDNARFNNNRERPDRRFNNNGNFGNDQRRDNWDNNNNDRPHNTYGKQDRAECRNFKKFGSCRFGHRCRYSHGPNDNRE